MTEARLLPPGTRVGPYTIGDPVGYGATAVVYRCGNELGQTFAIKIRRGGVHALDRRMVREFEAMRALRLPGVVRVHEVGFDDDLLWFSMDLVEGLPLVEAIGAISDFNLRIRKTAELGKQLFDVLDGLHSAGLVHRDIKPSNALVDAQGGLHVLDFGIARLFGASADDANSDTGQILGTLPYMAPEQVGGMPCDHRIDLYAAGWMLYDAIAGPRPRPGNAAAWIHRICLEMPVPLACRFREVPRDLSALIETVLDVNPDARGTAREAARRLRRWLAGKRSYGAWPEPAWVDPGDEWAPLERCIEPGPGSAFQILAAPAGSGKRRWAEQLHRQALLTGTRTLHLRCEATTIGRPIAELLERIILPERTANDPLLDSDATTFARVWPHLPLNTVDIADGALRLGDVAEAVARFVSRCANTAPLLLIFHDAEQIDVLTAAALERLVDSPPERLGVLLLVDPRWTTANSQKAIQSLQTKGVGTVTPGPLSPERARALAASLAPNAVPAPLGQCSPLAAVEAGLHALSAWRAEPWHPLNPSLRHLAITRNAVPEEAYTSLGGRLDDPWLISHDGDLEVDGRFANTVAGYFLAEPHRAARALATTWRETEGIRPDPGALAALHLRWGDLLGAWAPAVQAASRAQASGRFADAYRWLTLADYLPEDPANTDELRFEVARVRAEIALRTGRGICPPTWLEACSRIAVTRTQRQQLRVLAADVQFHAGAPKPAMVAALRLASASPPPELTIGVGALIVATEARLVLGQLVEAQQQIDRARAWLASVPESARTQNDRRLDVHVDNLEASLRFQRGELQSCRKLLQDTLRHAAEVRDIRGGAVAAARLGRTLRLLGKRRESEHQVRTAREAFIDTSDRYLGAEACLQLAGLRAERGDAAGACFHLAELSKYFRGNINEAWMGGVARIALRVAFLRGDEVDAILQLDPSGCDRDPELPAEVLRWHRSRGNAEAGWTVPEPPAGYGHAQWRLERARLALAAGDDDRARTEAEAAEKEAVRGAFSEVEVVARLVRGVIDPIDDAEWRELIRRANDSLDTELFLGNLELDALRLERQSDHRGARARWRTLQRRAAEVGHRPATEEAERRLSL